MTKLVSDLTKEELDEWVCRAASIDYTIIHYLDGDVVKAKGIDGYYSPSTNGGQAMELLKEFDVTINDFYVNGEPFIEVRCGTAETQIGVRNELEVLVCRAVIASHYGEEVPGDE